MKRECGEKEHNQAINRTRATPWFHDTQWYYGACRLSPRYGEHQGKKDYKMTFSRGEKIASLSLAATVLGSLAAWLALPETREWIGLDSNAPSTERIIPKIETIASKDGTIGEKERIPSPGVIIPVDKKRINPELDIPSPVVETQPYSIPAIKQSDNQYQEPSIGHRNQRQDKKEPQSNISQKKAETLVDKPRDSETEDLVKLGMKYSKWKIPQSNPISINNLKLKIYYTNVRKLDAAEFAYRLNAIGISTSYESVSNSEAQDHSLHLYYRYDQLITAKEIANVLCDIEILKIRQSDSGGKEIKIWLN